MNSANSVVEYTRELISYRLKRFERHARLAIDETEPAEIDVPQLGAAAERALAALALCERCCRHDSYPAVRNHLRQAANTAGRVIEVRFIKGLLQGEGLLPLAGRERVRERADGRLAAYGQRLAKLRRRMVGEGFAEQTQQLVQGMMWYADEPEPVLGEFVKASVFDAQSQICRAADLDESSLAIVHELSARLQQLNYILEMFQQVLRRDQWDSVIQDVNELQICIAPVVDYSSAKMRCTAWLEQSRDPDEMTALKSLIAFAGEESEHYYDQLASWWDAQRAWDLGTKFERALNMSSNPF